MLAPKLLSSSALGMSGTDRVMKIGNAAFPSDVYGCERRYILMEVIPEVLSRILGGLSMAWNGRFSAMRRMEIWYFSVSRWEC